MQKKDYFLFRGYCIVAITTISCLLSTHALQAQVATFTKVYNLLQANCVSCHYATSGNALILDGTETEVYNNLVNVIPDNMAAQQRGDKLVRPGYPEKSFLVRKTNHDLYANATLSSNEGDNMPAAAPLSPTDREIIRQWVMYGAPQTGSIDNEATIAAFYAGDSLPRIAPLAPPAPGTGFQVYLGTIFMAPDQEFEFIKKHEVPLGDSLEVVGIECVMNQFSHHYGVSKFREGFAADAPEGIRPMNDLFGAIDFFNNSAYIAGAQTPHNETFLPANTAFRWEPGATLNLNYHVYNYSANGILPSEAYINFYTQPRGTAQHEMQTATVTQANPFALYLPPNGQDITFTSDFYDAASNDLINIWLLTSHTHSRGRDFDIYKRTADGERGEQIYEGFYDSSYSIEQGFYDYTHPAVRHFEPMLPVPLNEGLIMDATYNNSSTEPISFGMSVNDEMFISYLLYTVEQGVSAETPTKPYPMLQVQPNPCRDKLRVAFELQKQSTTTLDLFDLTGRKIANLLNTSLPQGKHTPIISLADYDMPAGIYVLQLNTDGQTYTQRVVKM